MGVCVCARAHQKYKPLKCQFSQIRISEPYIVNLTLLTQSPVANSLASELNSDGMMCSDSIKTWPKDCSEDVICLVFTQAFVTTGHPRYNSCSLFGQEAGSTQHPLCRVWSWHVEHGWLSPDLHRVLQLWASMFSSSLNLQIRECLWGLNTVLILFQFHNRALNCVVLL